MRTSELLICDRCDTAQLRGPPAALATLHCARCDHQLYIPHAPPVGNMLALCLTGLIAFVVSNAFPVVTLSAHGHVRSATLLAAVSAAADQGAPAVAVIVAVVAFALPFAELMLYLWILLGVRRGRLPPGGRTGLHALRAIRHWSMVEVFLLAVIIAAVKLGHVAVVTPGAGVVALFVLVLCVALLRTFDLRDLWAGTETASP